MTTFAFLFVFIGYHPTPNPSPPQKKGKKLVIFSTPKVVELFQVYQI